MDTQSRSIKDIFTRKVGGEKYQYEANYTSGPRVEWNACVYQDGVLKGSLSGVVADSRLDADALHRSIVTLVEVAIEGLQGIKE